MEKNFIKIITVKMPPKMAKEIRDQFNEEVSKFGSALFMIAVQPVAATGKCEIALISTKVGRAIQNVIDLSQP